MKKLACPTVDELSRFNLGKLPEDETIQIGEHLDECEACRATIETISDASDTLASALKRPAPHNEYENESGLKRAALLIQAIGREPSFSSGQDAVSSGVDVTDLGELGQYKLLAKLGEGGMGAVYKALHTSLKRLVALKVLPAERMRDEQAVNRFRREMEAVGQLDHPNIVRATDAGEVDQTHYLVMELVDGIDLSTLVRRIGPLAPAVACELVRQAAVGLQEAHEHGMVHRDIKPSNLMLARQKRKEPIVKVLDLGLALLDEHRTSEQRGLTSTGQMMGTLDYMAPEQGGDSHIVDIRADIYALGATLYKLLCGQSPFAGEKYDTPIKMIRALALETPASIGEKRNDLPVELVAVVDCMLAKDPDGRFAEPEEVAEALAPFAKGADLELLLRKATEEDAENIEEASGVATHESLKSDSVETAPTIGLGSASRRGEAPGSPIEPTQVMKTATAKASRWPAPISQLSRLWNRVPPRARIATIAAALAGIILLSAIIFYIKTNHGTIVVEIDDPSISVTVQGEDIQITKGDSGEAYQIKPGEHTLHVKHGDLEFDTDKFKLSRGEEVVLSVRLVEGEVRVVQKDDEQTVIGSKRIAKENYALSYDGASYVDISTISLPDSTKPFTVEAKILSRRSERGVVVTASNRMGLTWNDVDADFDWWFGVVSGEKQIEAHRSSELATPAPVHVAGVWTGSQVRLFVNGKQVSHRLNTTANERPDKALLLIGSSIASGKGQEEPRLTNQADGIIDEVRISNVARYDKDFTPAERFEPDEHTLALYHFDEGQGEIAHDSSPNKHDGKIVGAKWVNADSLEQGRTKPSTPSRTPTSASSHALAFDGKSNYVEMASLKFDTSKANTLEAWVSTSGTQEPVIIHGCEPGFPSLAIGAGGYWKASCSIDGTSWRNQFGSEVANLNTRTHVAAVWTGTKAVLFVDGAREKAKEPGRYTPGSWPESKPFEIGAMRDESGSSRRYFFHGTIDEVRISNVARYDKDFMPAERFEPDEHTLALYHFDEGQGEIAHDSSPNKHHGKIVGAKWVKVGDLATPFFTTYESHAADKEVAELVLNMGGQVSLVGGTYPLRNVGQLPSQPFRVCDIDLNKVPRESILDTELDTFFKRIPELKELEAMHFYGVHIFKSRIRMEQISRVPKLYYVQLDETNVCAPGQSGLEPLTGMDQLTGIGLKHANVPDSELKHIATLANLTVLNLSANHVTDDGVEVLLPLERLTSLNLHKNRITDRGLALLTKMQNLEELQVGGNQVTLAGVAEFKSALPRCQISSDFTNEEIAAAIEKLKSDEKKKE